MVSGFLVACFGIVPQSRVRRPDGTPLAHYPHKGLWPELRAQSKLFRDWRLLVLFVPLFGSEIVVIVFSTLNCELTPISSIPDFQNGTKTYVSPKLSISTSAPAPLTRYATT